MCGGSGQTRHFKQTGLGLSPRVRGKRQYPCRPDFRGGSIPACAGEAIEVRYRQQLVAVYPRVCGGSQAHERSSWSHDGLSPRVRGKPIVALTGLESTRSIPACAGEAPGLERKPRPIWVYPRVCGGSTPRNTPRIAGTGLSPRVRGKHLPRFPPSELRWSIPACAGEAPPVPTTSYSRKVYPRVCGGSEGHISIEAVCHGLSPRVRGKQPEPQPGDTIVGSIPACAGEA